MIYFFPLIAILGAPAINILIVLTCFFFLIKFNYSNLDFIKKNFYLILLIIFWLYIFLLSFFSKHQIVAIYSSFFYIRFLIFSFAISWIVVNKINYQKFINFFLIAILFVDFDILLQYVTGFDIFGYPTLQGRNGGPFGDELVAGGFLSKISLPIFFFSLFKIKKGSLKEKLFNIFLLALTTFCIIVTGDRLPFFHIVIFLILGTFFFFNFKKFIIVFFTFLLLILILIKFSPEVQNRFNDTKNIFINFSLSSYYILYENGVEVWKTNKFFGVGIKNYNLICDEITKDFTFKSHQFCSSHPHNILLELMISTGIVGTFIFYSIFILFFREFFKLKINKLDKKLTLLFFGSCLTIIFYLNPISTTGSIFTSWNASFFWFHFGLSVGLLRLMIKKK